MDSLDVKGEIRRRIWRLLEERGVARFPKPIFGRIPNFVGAEEAAVRLKLLPEYERAGVIFCNPDSPQRPVRLMALRDGKTVVMATPRLRRGLLMLEPGRIPSYAFSEASTIRGAFRWGRSVKPWDVNIDMKVVGSVAVSPDGGRLGKGHGYSDLEYAILLECGAIGEETPIVTTVHELQIVDRIPMGPYDVPVDVIVTPKRCIRTETPYKRPSGIDWSLVDGRVMNEIPILRDVRSKGGCLRPST